MKKNIISISFLLAFAISNYASDTKELYIQGYNFTGHDDMQSATVLANQYGILGFTSVFMSVDAMVVAYPNWGSCGSSAEITLTNYAGSVVRHLHAWYHDYIGGEGRYDGNYNWDGSCVCSKIKQIDLAVHCYNGNYPNGPVAAYRAYANASFSW